MGFLRKETTTMTIVLKANKKLLEALHEFKETRAIDLAFEICDSLIKELEK